MERSVGGGWGARGQDERRKGVDAEAELVALQRFAGLASTIPTFLATSAAVSTASPVVITHLWPLFLWSATTAMVSFLTGHVRTMKPAKVRPASRSFRARYLTEAIK